MGTQSLYCGCNGNTFYGINVSGNDPAYQSMTIPAADGLVCLGNDLVKATGNSINFNGFAVGGSTIAQWNSTYFADAVASNTAANMTPDYIIWEQGETDAAIGTTQADYYRAFSTLLARIKTYYPNAKVLLVYIGHSASFASYNTIKLALQQTLNTNPSGNLYYGADMSDISYAFDPDMQGLNGEDIAGHRLAQSILYLNGEKTYNARGPYISGLNAVDSMDTDIYMVHNGGTDFTPSTGISTAAFTLTCGGSAVTIYSAARETATSIRLYHGACAGTRIATYLSGKYSNVTDLVHDNTSLALPLEWNYNITQVSLPKGQQ